MSTDYYLYSPSRKKATMVGSIGLSGTKAWPIEYGGRSFIAWAITEFIEDVILVNENVLPEDVEIHYYGTAGKGNGT